MAKSIYVFAAAVAAAAVFSGCGKKAEATASAAEKPLIMITESGFPPYEYNEGEQIVGVDVEICKAVAAKLNRPLTIQDAKFDAVIPSVIAGKADFAAAGITVTEDRKQNVDFSIPYVTSGIVIVSKKGEEFTTVEALKGKRIGVQSGTTSDGFCVETVGQEPERFDAPPTAAAALVAGKVDALIVDIDPAKNIVKGADTIVISSDFLTKEEFAVAIRKGQPELLAAMNEVIEALVKEGKIEAWKAEYDARYAALRGVEETAAAVEEKAAEGLSAITGKLAEGVAAAKEAVADTAKAATDKVAEGAAAVADVAKEATEKVAEGAVAAKEAVADVAKEATDKVAEGAAAVVDTAKEATEKVAEGAVAVKDAVVDTAKAATEKVAEGVAAAKDAVAGAADATAEKAEAAAEKVEAAAAEKAEAAAEKVEAAAEKVEAAAKPEASTEVK